MCATSAPSPTSVLPLTPDAGKTTLTERILYFSGALETMGEVHHGTAVMDYLETERERGITIQSACVSFSHNNCQVNLIDTPGHADFNFEVERSLRVLDGALVIIDAVKGVEAQTTTVVKQANRYRIPKIFVFNKMDQEGADFDAALRDVQGKFKLKCLPVCIPVYADDHFFGALDVLRQRVLFWKELSSEQRNLQGVPASNFDHPSFALEIDALRSMHFAGAHLADLTEDSVVLGHQIDLPALVEQFGSAMEEIISVLSEEDPQILDDFFNETVAKHFHRFPELVAGLVSKHPNEYALGIPCSALKFRNVQQVMDAVVDYLPAPRPFLADFDDMYREYTEQTPERVRVSKERLLTQLSKSNIFFIFKRVIDPDLGHLAFGRMYLGELKYGARVKALYSNLDVKVNSLYRVRANELSQIKTIEAGDIVCMSIQDKVKSGDYLVAGEGVEHWRQFLPPAYAESKPVYISSLGFDSPKERQ